MVDIWLLFCIATIFLIIIFHTLIDASTNSSEDKEEESHVLKLSFNPGKNAVMKLQGVADKPSYCSAHLTRILIMASRVIVLLLVALFNALYWGTIVF